MASGADAKWDLVAAPAPPPPVRAACQRPIGNLALYLQPIGNDCAPAMDASAQFALPDGHNADSSIDTCP